MSPETKADDSEVKKDTQAEYELTLMRHGSAVMRGSEGFSDDAKRPLTPQGKKKMKEIAGGLAAMGFQADWVISSPLVRAVETAEIVAESLRAGVPMDFCDALRPGGSAEELISFLAKQGNRRRVLVVGHEPDLSSMVARLIGAGRHANLAFKKGGCCLIAFREFPPKSPGQLVWWLTPRALRRMA